MSVRLLPRYYGRVNGKRGSKVRVYYAGCGANALSGPQNPQIQLIAPLHRPDKRSASGNFSRFIIPSATFQQTLAPPGLPDRNISRQIHYQPDSVQDSVPRCARHAILLHGQNQPPDKHAGCANSDENIGHRQRHINFIHAERHLTKPYYVWT